MDEAEEEFSIKTESMEMEKEDEAQRATPGSMS
jgi:hypothetical protein